jgi:ribosomal protein S18 acetylase RimI-like enzyme
MYARDQAGRDYFRVDGGFTDWTQQFLSNRKERLLISGLGSEQVAWDRATDQVAGQVRTFIDHEQNKLYDRQRGYTEMISVRRPFRRRGLARALIVRSLRVQKQAGMTESALGVDSENLSGATKVYEDCGFRVVKRNTIYKKPLLTIGPT